MFCEIYELYLLDLIAHIVCIVDPAGKKLLQRDYDGWISADMEGWGNDLEKVKVLEKYFSAVRFQSVCLNTFKVMFVNIVYLQNTATSYVFRWFYESLGK